MSIQKVSASDNIFHKTLLRDNLKAIFGDFDETILHSVEDKLEWLELEGGDVLIKEGDIGDSLYFVLSGRLEATVLLENGTSNKIGEIVRGETVGEMSIYTGEPRFATVTALRNCVLVKLSKTLFEEILESYPQVSLNVTKLVIERFKKNQNKLITNHLINICIISIHDSIDLSTISTYIFNKLKLQNEVLLLDKGFIEESFGPLPEHNDDSGDYSKKLTNWLNNQEANHDTMLYVCNEKDDYWYTKSIRQADHIVILADSTAKPKVTSIEISKLAKVNAIKTFILVHPEDTFTPSNTRNWLALRPWFDNDLHIKKENLKDLNRLARVVSGNAIGIVFAGGGAKGFAHLGIIKALQEYGIVYDYLRGTSVGAIMASANAFDRPIDEVINIGRKAAFYNPSKDINFLPLLSIIKGKRLKMMNGNAIKALSGTNKIDIEDTWKPLFIIATNFTKAEEQVLMR
ncbi:MAG TPA: cyclic nucleotide-binding and patatin-like phospholipase domain-containing protein, partial [Saprospiraceae bacterium]|nr:cyclic nucleotide-binding and patatin-like phospholipase domain-containing protein [Saprospiraceae bacterium]